MNAVENVEAVLEADPDGWVFAAVKGDDANSLVQKRDNYGDEVRCLGILMVILSRRTEASIDKVAIDAARFARENKDAPGIERQSEM